MHKRIISIALAILMCLSVFSLSVAAAPSPGITCSYAGGVVTFTGSGFDTSTSYNVRLVNSTTNSVVTMKEATSDPYGNINVTDNTGTLNLSDSYMVYCNTPVGGVLAAQNTSLINGSALYYITVQNDGNGTGSANAAANQGANVTLTATPNPGYRLQTWQVLSGGITISANSFTMQNDNVVVKAIFELIPPAVPTISASYSGGVVTYTGSGFAASTNYNIRVVDTTAGSPELISMKSISSNASGNIINATDTVGMLAKPSYTIYVNNLDGTLAAQGILLTNTSTNNAQTPIITTQPSSTTVYINGTATLTVSARVTDGGTLSYQWYSNTSNSSTGGTAISGATAATYSVPTATEGTKYYYVVVKNTNNTVSGTKIVTATSSVAKVTVSTSTSSPGGSSSGGGGGSSSGGSGGGSGGGWGSTWTPTTTGKTTTVVLNGQNLTVALNDDGSINLTPSDIASHGKPFVLSLPSVVAPSQNGNAYVAVVNKDGKEVILPFSVYKDGMTKVLTSTAGTYKAIYNLKSFKDTSGHWALNNITFVAAHELFSGVGDDRFDPNASMTRAMFAAVLARIDGVNLTAYGSSRFSDVPFGQWYTKSVEWAADKNIVQGVGNDKFNPNAFITREQMTVMLNNYINYKNYDLKSTATTSSFNDADKISSWASDAVLKIQKAGLISGKPGGKFDPQGTATRAEVATIFTQFIYAMIE